MDAANNGAHEQPTDPPHPDDVAAAAGQDVKDLHLQAAIYRELRFLKTQMHNVLASLASQPFHLDLADSEKKLVLEGLCFVAPEASQEDGENLKFRVVKAITIYGEEQPYEIVATDVDADTAALHMTKLYIELMLELAG